MLSESSKALLELPFNGREIFRCPMGVFHTFMNKEGILPFFDTAFYKINCVKENDLSKRNALLVDKIIKCPNFFENSVCWKNFEEQRNEAVLQKDTEVLNDQLQGLLAFTHADSANNKLSIEDADNIREVGKVFLDEKLTRNYLISLRQQNPVKR